MHWPLSFFCCCARPRYLSMRRYIPRYSRFDACFFCFCFFGLPRTAHRHCAPSNCPSVAQPTSCPTLTSKVSVGVGRGLPPSASPKQATQQRHLPIRCAATPGCDRRLLRLARPSRSLGKLTVAELSLAAAQTGHVPARPVNDLPRAWVRGFANDFTLRKWSTYNLFDESAWFRNRNQPRTGLPGAFFFSFYFWAVLILVSAGYSGFYFRSVCAG